MSHTPSLPGAPSLESMIARGATREIIRETDSHLVQIKPTKEEEVLLVHLTSDAESAHDPNRVDHCFVSGLCLHDSGAIAFLLGLPFVEGSAKIKGVDLPQHFRQPMPFSLVAHGQWESVEIVRHEAWMSRTLEDLAKETEDAKEEGAGEGEVPAANGEAV